MNLLFLYSEVAGYFLASATTLHTDFGYNIHIITRPNDPAAPYVFPERKGISFYPRKDMNAAEIYALYEKLKPKFVYISGWADDVYMKVALQIRKDPIPVICSCDNQWKGNLRQIMAGIFRRKYLRKRFSHIFIAGMYQYPLAIHLGFKKRQILLGMNTADLTIFHRAYHDQLADKAENYPHNFLYVGRLIEIKGIMEMAEAFIELANEKKHDWTLTLVGSGQLKTSLPQHERIEVKEFLQQEKLPDLVGNSGCFVLPSRIEPWGVVLHEFAGAGLPLISSNICGAATAFVKAGYNGFQHEPMSKQSIKEAMSQIIDTKDKDLIEMGNRSYMLSYQITKESWSTTLLSAKI